MTVYLVQQLAKFFHKGLDGKYGSLPRPRGLCHSDSTVLVVGKQPQTRRKQKGMFFSRRRCPAGAGLDFESR